MLRRHIDLDQHLDIPSSLSALQHGADDPTTRVGPDGVWRATRTPQGPGTVHLSNVAGGIDVAAWGDGAEWLLERAEALSGAADDPTPFDPTLHPAVHRLWRRHPGLRLPRTGSVVEALVPAVLGQRVTLFEARRSFRQIVVRYGEAAPGPGGLLLPPEPGRLAGIPYYDLHQCGIERGRADTLRRLAANAASLEMCAAMAPAEARRRLTSIAGIGPWTAALATAEALADPDAVPIGDLHLPDQVAWMLAGERNGDDARMLDLLEPWHGQRGRVVQLALVAAVRPPRRAPRMAVADISQR